MQKIANSPLQVDKYYLKELIFQINQDVEINEDSFGTLEIPVIDIITEVKVLAESERSWRCDLIVYTKENKNTPYSFRIVLVGYFLVDPEYPEDRIELLVKTNCPSILYSTSREMLTTTIRRSPFPPIRLPSVMFLEIPDEEKKKIKSNGKKPGLKK
jgi:preprotein translocase subunit SecB